MKLIENQEKITSLEEENKKVQKKKNQRNRRKLKSFK